ncbi:MAG: hypothetical protein IJO32_02840 [Bacilli bacterium]|nr:hypothetical protein [Bacilli bacterium]
MILEQHLGRIRTTPVNIGGTSWKPQFPIESQIKEELLNQKEKTKTEIANKIMIDNGCGTITIFQENQPTFFEKLIKYYETNDMIDLKQWIYNTTIDGIDL